MGVPLRELEDYATQVEQAPFIHRLPRYPKLKANALCHPRNGEIVDRLEYYHEHLPPLIKVPPSHQGSVFLLIYQLVLVGVCEAADDGSPLLLLHRAQRSSIGRFRFCKWGKLTTHYNNSRGSSLYIDLHDGYRRATASQARES